MKSLGGQRCKPPALSQGLHSRKPLMVKTALVTPPPRRSLSSSSSSSSANHIKPTAASVRRREDRSKPISFASVPIEVIEGSVGPFLTGVDLVSLSASCRYYHTELHCNESLWSSLLCHLRREEAAATKGQGTKGESAPTAVSTSKSSKQVYIAIYKRMARLRVDKFKRRLSKCLVRKGGDVSLALQEHVNIAGLQVEVMVNGERADIINSVSKAAGGKGGEGSGDRGKAFKTSLCMKVAVQELMSVSQLNTLQVHVKSRELNSCKTDIVSAELNVRSSRGGSVKKWPAFASSSDGSLLLHKFQVPMMCDGSRSRSNNGGGGSGGVRQYKESRCGTIIAGSWAGEQVAFLYVNLPLPHLLRPILYDTPLFAINNEHYSDTDPSYGLQGLSASVTLRTFGQCMWEGTFSKVDADPLEIGAAKGGGRDCDARGGARSRERNTRFVLLSTDGATTDLTRVVTCKTKEGRVAGAGVDANTLTTRPFLSCNCPPFNLPVPDTVIIDWTLWDDQGLPFFSESTLVKVGKMQGEELQEVGLGYNEDDVYEGSAWCVRGGDLASKGAALSLVAVRGRRAGHTVVSSLLFDLDWAFINSHFQTTYGLS